jgi:putative endonuclease
MSFVYILHSQQVDRFYIGFTTISVQDRLSHHLEKYYKNKYTGIANDWQEFLVVDCESEKQARSIEAHIKRMKSRVYLLNLKRYPEMISKLKAKYKDS